MKKRFNWFAIILIMCLISNSIVSFANEISEPVNIMLTGFDECNVAYFEEGNTSRSGTPIIINGVEYFTEDEAKEIASSIELINNSEDTLTLSEVKCSSWDGSYFVSFRKQLKEAKLGTEASFTLKYKNYEQTYTIKVMDYNSAIKSISRVNYGDNPDENGALIIDAEMNNKDMAYCTVVGFEFMNYNDMPISLDSGIIDLSKVEISEGSGFQFYNPDNIQEDGIAGNDSEATIKDDTVVLARIGVDAYDNPAIQIKAVREGDAYFTVSYENISQVFRIIATNPNNYPSDIVLDKSEVVVKPNDEVVISSEVYPSNAQYLSSNWVVRDNVSGKILSKDNYVLVDNGNSAKIKFYVEGDYLVYRSLDVSYEFDGCSYTSNVCRVVVSEDDVVVTPKPMETIKPTGAPTPTGTPVPSETIEPNPSETIKPTETIAPTPSETIEPTGTPTIEPTSTPSRVYRLGDVDVNDSVTARDALAILKHSAKIEDLEGISLQLADLDGDGIINSRDALSVLKISAKIEDERFVEL